MDCAALDRGITLFNQRRYFEAHEVWEAAWLVSKGENRLILQCLIQSAAALLHAERGNSRGARSVWAKACEKLERLPDKFAGIDLCALRCAISQVISEQTGMVKEIPALRRET